MASTKPTDLAASVAKLTIDPVKSRAVKSGKPKKNKVAESWEDEEVSSDDDGAPMSPGPSENQTAGTAAPPPTPMSPSYHQIASQVPFETSGQSSPLTANWSTGDSNSSTSTPARRPEKTDAVARRIIASALGVKVPKQTEEQKAYDRSLREAERKRREEERATQKRQEEAKEEAKRAIWED